jgi:hypothetical protein
MFLNKYFSKLVIGILVVVCTWCGRNLDTWGQNKVIDNDVVSYYAYLPAVVIFHDLNFSFVKDLPQGFTGRIWVNTAPNGKPLLRMTMGMAFLWLPFFLLAHLFSKVMGIEALGYSWPYSLSIFAATIFYLLIGLIFLRKILLKYFSEVITGITILLVVLATNLMYYVVSEPGMSHVYSFSLITIFLYTTFKWVERPTVASSLILGLLAGLIVLIRPVNGLVLIFPALISINSFSEFYQRLITRWKLIAFAGLAAILIATPQLIYWKMQTGHLFFNSYMDQVRFYFGNPHLIDGLFSFRKGWFIYTPVMLFSIVGLFFLKRTVAGFTRAVIVFLVLFTYVIFSWWCWWYGGSFGSRPMIDTYGFMAIPLAAFLAALTNRAIWQKAVIGLVLVLMIFLNQKQMGQYRTSLLHWDSMTRKAYFSIFLKKDWPEGYDKMIQIPDYEKALKGEKEY